MHCYTRLLLGRFEGIQGPKLTEITRGRRSKFDIIAKLLEIASEGTTKTNLVYRSNLNFKVVQRYIEMLIGRELLEVVESEGLTIYRTTVKGAAAVGAIRSATGLVTGDPESTMPPIESRWDKPRRTPSAALMRYPIRAGVLEPID